MFTIVLGRGESSMLTLIIIFQMNIDGFLYIIQKWGQNLRGKKWFWVSVFLPKNRHDPI